MRTLHLYCHRDEETLVQGLDAPNAVTVLTAVQEDRLRIISHSLSPNAARPQFPFFIEQPFDFTSMRVAIGLVDQPPRRGTFQIRVLDQTTTVLTWPAAADLDTPAKVAAWKAGVLAALKALSNVADDAIRGDDPADSPAHFLDFAWTDPARTDPIELVQNRLFPRTRCVTIASPGEAGYTQRLKLIQFPYVAGVDFTRPYPPVASIAPSKTGTVGTNEERILVVPSAAQGSLSLTWSGASTGTLDVASLSATAIAAALNAIVPAGASNPSFSVAPRSSPDGSRRWSIQFIGPLAATPRPGLGVDMHDQIARPWVIGEMPLRGNFGIEQALNGQLAVDLILELNIDDEESYLVTLTVRNSLTDPDTVADIEDAAGGIITVTETVVIDESTAEPFATLQAGLEFPIIDAAIGANEVTCTHPNWGRLVAVLVFNQTATSPETWRECKDTEYANASASDTTTVVTFPFVFSADSASPHFTGKWKIRLLDPDAALSLNAHKHAWIDLLETLPDGMTLVDKLAAIEAALGMTAGVLSIDASKITGLLTPAQIDREALGASLGASSTFVDAMVTKLGVATSFATTLASVIAANTTITDGISTSLTTSAIFTSTMRTLVLDILQGSVGSLPTGTTLYRIDPFELVMPPPKQIAGTSISHVEPATEESTVTSGDTSSKVTRLIDQTVTTAGLETRYAALSPQLPALSSGGGVTGRLPDVGDSTHYFTVGAGGAQSRSSRGRRGRNFKAGATLIFTAGHWCEAAASGTGGYYDLEYDAVAIKTLFVDSNAFVGSRRFDLDWQIFCQLAGNAAGEINMTAQIAPLATTLTWATIFSRVLHLGPSGVLRDYGVSITRAADGSLTGEYRQQGRALSWTPTLTDFALRVIVTRFNCEPLADPRGSLTLRIPTGAASASIVAL